MSYDPDMDDPVFRINYERAKANPGCLTPPPSMTRVDRVGAVLGWAVKLFLLFIVIGGTFGAMAAEAIHWLLN